MSSSQNSATNLQEMSPITVTRYAIINTSAPFDRLKGKESLDAALILASYEMDVSLFFIGNGVYQTQANQQAESIAHKDYLATFKALEFYDIEDIYLCQDSLTERGLATDSVFDDAQYLSAEQIKALLPQFDVVLTF